jgi:acyl carrier protein
MMDRDSLVQTIAEMIRDSLGIPDYRVECDEDLDMLGDALDSVEYMTLLATIQQQLHVTLPDDRTVDPYGRLSELVDRFIALTTGATHEPRAG